jgi:hypothetical protein
MASGQLGDTLYATDFINTLYTVNPVTGKAKMIGLTGMPALRFIPGPNPNGTINVFDETLFEGVRKLYANFGAAILQPDGPRSVVIAPAIYEINPKTGRATFVASTELGMLGIVTVNNMVFAFSAQSGRVVTLDVKSGKTRSVSDLDPDVGLIDGATPVHIDDNRREGSDWDN